MEPLPRTPQTYIERVCGLTPWVLTADSPPPFRGWWLTIRITPEFTGVVRRRYWHEVSGWSMPALPDMTDLQCDEAMFMPCMNINRQKKDIWWCGLQRPHLAGYQEYGLVPTPRTSIKQVLRTLRSATAILRMQIPHVLRKTRG
jgi:hypothetical protein